MQSVHGTWLFRTELRSIQGSQLSGTELRSVHGTHLSGTVNPRLCSLIIKAGRWDHIDGFEHRGKALPRRDLSMASAAEWLGGRRSLEGEGSLSMSRDVYLI